MRIILLVSVIAALCTGCDEKKGAATPAGAEPKAAVAPAPTIVAHCDAIEGMSTCMDFETEAKANSECASFEGVVAKGACPKAGQSGRCVLPSGDIRNYYSTGGSPNTAEYAKGHCKNSMGGKLLEG
jgi:hypothetical protein